MKKLLTIAIGLLLLIGGNARADVVHPDDVIIQGSACVGFDCVNGESFGFDTIRLKENNLRIRFVDTSSTASFPTVDWQLTANDTSNGGADKFSIDNIDKGTTPFTIMDGAPSHSLFVSSAGRLGLGTSTPVVNIHVKTGNTPTLRLEQDGSSGFTPQTWDVAGNETNFFIRDATNGSKLPFRIFPNAPSNSLDIAATGNVGVGTSSPTEQLHVLKNADANSFILMENSNGGLGAAAVVRTKSDIATLNFQSHAGARTITRFGQVLGGWGEFLLAGGNGLAVGTLGNVPLVLGANNLQRVLVNNAGVQVFGTFTNSSSREYKEDITMLKTDEAMSTLAGLQPMKFRYKGQTEENLGFIAEDVPDLVAVEGRKSIAPMDMIALLTKVVQEQQKTIESLSEQMAKLELQP